MYVCIDINRESLEYIRTVFSQLLSNLITFWEKIQLKVLEFITEWESKSKLRIKNANPTVYSNFTEIHWNFTGIWRKFLWKMHGNDQIWISHIWFSDDFNNNNESCNSQYKWCPTNDSIYICYHWVCNITFNEFFIFLSNKGGEKSAQKYWGSRERK